MERITASLATIPGREESLKETIESLLPQVDKINVFLHGYNQVPDFLLNEKIELAFEQEWGNCGDLDKFRWVDEIEGYHLVCDDDLIYPPDYAEKMIEAIESHKRKAVVSFHGIELFKFPIASYYRDRKVYPCLDRVKEPKLVDLVGTGVCGYHSELPIKEFNYIKELLHNMADIHFGIFLKKKGIPAYVVEHDRGWIQHSKNVDLNKTIYAQSVNKDYEHTEILDQNRQYFRKEKADTKLPLVSVVIINTRGRSHPMYLKQCFDAVRNQSYPNIEPIVVKNIGALQTIGKCWNEGVKTANGKWILFLGDDDFITEDYVYSMLDQAERQEKTSVVAGITSYLTMFSDEGKTEPRELIPTGMWKREYLLENPFKEYLTKYVDTEFMDRARELGQQQIICKWHYGYFYRSHSMQVSGHKLLVGAHVKDPGSSEIKEQLKKTKSVEV